jgi:hypothetical protein
MAMAAAAVDACARWQQWQGRQWCLGIITCPLLARVMAMAMAAVETTHKPTASLNLINIQS